MVKTDLIKRLQEPSRRRSVRAWRLAMKEWLADNAKARQEWLRRQNAQQLHQEGE